MTTGSDFIHLVKKRETGRPSSPNLSMERPLDRPLGSRLARLPMLVLLPLSAKGWLAFQEPPRTVAHEMPCAPRTISARPPLAMASSHSFVSSSMAAFRPCGLSTCSGKIPVAPGFQSGQQLL